MVDAAAVRPRAPARELLRKSLPFVAPFRRQLARVFWMALSGAAIGAAEPLALKWIFDELGGRRETRPLLQAGALLAAILVCKELLGVRLDRALWRVRIAVHESVTHATVDRLHALPLAYHRNESVGAIMTKMDRGINGAIAAFSDLAFHMVPTLAYLVISVAVMAHLDWRVTLLVCAFVPVPPLLSAWASPEQVQRERRLMDSWTNLFARFSEVLGAIAVVKSFSMEEMEKRRFLSGVKEANGLVLRGVATDSRVGAAKNLAVVLARLSAVALGGFLVARGELSLGTLVAFLGYLGALFGPVQGLAGMLQKARRGTVALETVFSILDEPDSVADAPDAVELASVRGGVEFRGVTFGYRANHRIIRNVDLRVEQGETVALVGPSGSGKTTLMALLQRLYDPILGQVLIDGFDVRRVSQRSLRANIGVVSQESILFSDSIRDNIGFGRPGATLESIVRAARSAHAHEFIVQLPDGYDTRIGDRGSLLSAGQRQRIAIARALLKDPAVLILDEATSALDAESEALVRDAMARLEEGRTTFVVAHRLETVTSADRILVFREGEIVESGTHEQLMLDRGYYASLVDRQVRGLLVDAA
jgi:ATP-binding cassette subfamily B protein